MVSEAREKVEAREMKKSEFRNPAAFTSWIYSLVLTICFVIMHRANYPGSDLARIWWVLLVVPYGLFSARGYFKVPDTKVWQAPRQKRKQYTFKST